MLAFDIPWKGKTSHGTMVGLFLTDVLLVVGGLAPRHALPERKVFLSHEPGGWSLSRILSRGACGSSWGGRWLGSAFAPEINNNQYLFPLKQAHESVKINVSSLRIGEHILLLYVS